MPRPMGHIHILLSSRVLLNLEKANEIFRTKGVEAYTDYLCARGRYKKDFDPEIGGRRLEKGPMWGLAEAALKLNEATGKPLVEVGLYCKDDHLTALPIFRNLDVQGLGGIDFRIATNGRELSAEHHRAFQTDLLLTRNPKDAQAAIDLDIAAASIHIPEKDFSYRHEGRAIQLWVDGDAVAFGSSSEVRYRKEGLQVYRELERKEFNKSIEPGPFSKVLAKISQLNAKFERGEQPFDIALVTARGGDSASRVLTIARDHGINFNAGMYFMGGAAKVNPLSAHKPDLYLDDQISHLQESCTHCPTGLVAYKADSPMHRFQAEQAKAAAAKDTPVAKEFKVASAGEALKEASVPAQVKMPPIPLPPRAG